MRKKNNFDNVQKVSTTAEWLKKADEIYTLTLPSGVVVKVKKLNLVDLAITGYIPFELITSSIKTAQTLSSTDKWEAISKEDLSNIVEMFDKAIQLAVVEPKVTADGANDTMPVSKVPFADKFYIFSNVVDTRSAEILKPFR